MFNPLHKSTVFTKCLPPESLTPTIEAAKELCASPDNVLRRARAVKGGIFTWISPEHFEKTKLLAVSQAAMTDLGFKADEELHEDFQHIVAGQKILDGTYPWAQAYAGWQFGQWAGQLGDGRAMSLFEITNTTTKKRYELQLKGAGRTPYSRFADGKAVLRSSIREFLGSEAVNALGIPTTRALSLTSLPETYARRERMETCAIVCRMAESWLRIGTFDLLRARGDTDLLKQLADYAINNVFDNHLVPSFANFEPTRYRQLYREIVLRNARTVAHWQAYGYMNGVLNTDNTSIFGLTIDYGPFAFMDTYDPAYSPNHDDDLLRYSYRNQVKVIWWNLVRLGEDLIPLIGPSKEADVDTSNSSDVQSLVEAATKIIESARDDYNDEAGSVYKELMRDRLGLKTIKPSDSKLIESFFDAMEDGGLDFNQSFRTLANTKLFSTEKPNLEAFLPKTPSLATMSSPSDTLKQLEKFLSSYKARLEEDGIIDDLERQVSMHRKNPKFVLKNWICDEVIIAAMNDDTSKLEAVLKMALEPFNESWGLDKELEERYCGEVPKSHRDLQCSCSS